MSVPLLLQILSRYPRVCRFRKAKSFPESSNIQTKHELWLHAQNGVNRQAKNSSCATIVIINRLCSLKGPEASEYYHITIKDSSHPLHLWRCTLNLVYG